MATNHIKNPYLCSSSSSSPTEQQRTTGTKKEEVAVLLPSYADPKKIRKYESVRATFGERPAYVMQKKGGTNRLFG
jgi:hypothetical protein